MWLQDVTLNETPVEDRERTYITMWDRIAANADTHPETCARGVKTAVRLVFGFSCSIQQQ